MIFGVNTLPAYRNHGYAGELLKRAIADAKDQGRKRSCPYVQRPAGALLCKNLVLKMKEFQKSVHGNIVWNQMRLKF